MLFPPRIIWRDPLGLDTADSAGRCRCDDGFEYALKDTRSHRLAPHAEWFCTKLAETVGIPCPPCSEIDDTEGSLIFGSRWEGAVIENWWNILGRGEIDREYVSKIISRIFAFDLFVYNDDRHFNNYLVRGMRSGWVVLAYDWSRAWTYHGFPPNKLPFQPKQKTLMVHRILKNKYGVILDYASVSVVLDRLAAVNESNVENIVNDHPKAWLTDSDRDAILLWWRSGQRLDRIGAIGKGIKDGSYL